jgi:GDP-L-fucose synthase
MILITGANGFLGSHVVPRFKDYSIATPTSRMYDLTNIYAVNKLFQIYRPKIVLHMAAVCGGILANKNSPADFIHKNVKMTSNIFDAVIKHNVEYLYTLGSVCAYPKYCPVPFKEEDLWNGLPEETNAPYGQAKRLQLSMQQAYRQQYGLKGAHLIPVNMYGEHDHFDLTNSHVIPALIRKYVEANEQNKPSVPVWGTGEATREFLYAGDCAKAIHKAIVDRFDCYNPINIGTGVDISIKDLAYLVADMVGYRGQTVFTGEVSDGQPKRQLDVSRAKKLLGFEAKTDFRTGLRKTIDWYLATRKERYDR